MFGAMSPTQTYERIGLETSVKDAHPHRLVLLLFEGATTAIAIARTHMNSGERALKGQAISKAIDIINNGLKASLDVAQGGELAERLGALYQYMVTRLLYANLKDNVAALDEVSGLLGEIHGAWKEIGKSQGPETPAP